MSRLATTIFLSLVWQAIAFSPFGIVQKIFSWSLFENAPAKDDELALQLQQNQEKSCWHKPHVQQLIERYCVALTDEGRSRIAISITNCHMDSAGLPTTPCDDEETIRDCTMRIGTSVIAYQTYTTFYSHVDSLCYFMKREHFQRSTEDAINSLFAATVHSAELFNNLGANVRSVETAIAENHGVLSKNIAELTDLEKQRFEALERATASLEEGQAAAARHITDMGGALIGLTEQQQFAFERAREHVAMLAGTTSDGFSAVLKSQESVSAQIGLTQAQLGDLQALSAQLAVMQGGLVAQAGAISNQLEHTRGFLGDLLREALDHVAHLRIEFLSLSAFLFYPLVALVALPLTSVERTARARAPIFFLTALAFVLERVLGRGARAPLVAHHALLYAYCLARGAVVFFWRERVQPWLGLSPSSAHTTLTAQEALLEVLPTYDEHTYCPALYDPADGDLILYKLWYGPRVGAREHVRTHAELLARSPQAGFVSTLSRLTEGLRQLAQRQGTAENAHAPLSAQAVEQQGAHALPQRTRDGNAEDLGATTGASSGFSAEFFPDADFAPHTRAEASQDPLFSLTAESADTPLTANEHSTDTFAATRAAIVPAGAQAVAALLSGMLADTVAALAPVPELPYVPQVSPAQFALHVDFIRAALCYAAAAALALAAVVYRDRLASLVAEVGALRREQQLNTRLLQELLAVVAANTQAPEAEKPAQGASRSGSSRAGALAASLWALFPSHAAPAAATTTSATAAATTTALVYTAAAAVPPSPLAHAHASATQEHLLPTLALPAPAPATGASSALPHALPQPRQSPALPPGPSSYQTPLRTRTSAPTLPTVVEEGSEEDGEDTADGDSMATAVGRSPATTRTVSPARAPGSVGRSRVLASRSDVIAPATPARTRATPRATPASATRTATTATASPTPTLTPRRRARAQLDEQGSAHDAVEDVQPARKRERPSPREAVSVAACADALPRAIDFDELDVSVEGSTLSQGRRRSARISRSMSRA